MSIDSPVPDDPQVAAIQEGSTRTPIAASPQTAAALTREAALQRVASAARVAKYFKHRWPDRAAGDFSNDEAHAVRHGAEPSALSVELVEIRDFDARAKDTDAIAQLLQVAENEGWKPLAMSTSVLKHPSPARRAGVRRSVYLR